MGELLVFIAEKINLLYIFLSKIIVQEGKIPPIKSMYIVYHENIFAKLLLIIMVFHSKNKRNNLSIVLEL